MKHTSLKLASINLSFWFCNYQDSQFETRMLHVVLALYFCYRSVIEIPRLSDLLNSISMKGQITVKY